MSRRDELMKKNASIRSTAEISDAEVNDARQNHRPRSGQGSFAQRQRLEDRIKELEDKLGATDGSLIELDQIAPNPWQPRRVFSDDELDKLAMSIQEVGLIQPILVRRVSNRDTIESVPSYQIIAGERRYKAHQRLGKPTIKVILLEATDAEMAALALAENIDRTDLTAYEIAVAIKNAEPMFETRTGLASALGMNRTTIYKYKSFFRLPQFVLDDLEINPGILGRDAADALATLINRDGSAAEDRLRNLWPRVKAGELDQGKIVSTIEAALKHGGTVRTERNIKKLFLDKQQAGSITRDDAALTIKVRVAALTPEREAELRAFVERMFS